LVRNNQSFPLILFINIVQYQNVSDGWQVDTGTFALLGKEAGKLK